jgi:hypothetical protein
VRPQTSHSTIGYRGPVADIASGQTLVLVDSQPTPLLFAYQVAGARWAPLAAALTISLKALTQPARRRFLSQSAKAGYESDGE